MNYPSLRDNNILRRVLVSEVMFWAGKLKRRFLEKMVNKKDEAEHQTDVGERQKSQQVNATMVYVPTKYSTCFLR